MRYKIFALVAAFAFVLNGIGASFAQTKATAAVQTKNSPRFFPSRMA
jgi:hypothetical protein